MANQFRPHSALARFVRQLFNLIRQQQNLQMRQPMKVFNRRKPYSAIANLAFSMFRWLFLFCMGITLLVLLVGFTISRGIAASIFMEVMPVIKVFSSVTFVVYALACIKESV